MNICKTRKKQNQQFSDQRTFFSGIIEQPNLFDKADQNSADRSTPESNQSLSANDKYTRLEESRSVTPSPPLNTYLLDVKRNQHIPSLSPIDSVETSPTTESLETTTVTSRYLRPKLLNIPSMGLLKKGELKKIVSSKF